MARQTARTPSYSDISQGEWSAPSFSRYVECYFENNPDAERPDDAINDVSEAPQAMLNWIAARTLLGDSEAETADQLIVFPCVEPCPDALNESSLRAVISGRGAQADISEEALTSARKKAYSLLVSEFDYDQDEVPEEYKEKKSFGEQVAEAIKQKTEEIKDN
jgi:hypothetical protein